MEAVGPRFCIQRNNSNLIETNKIQKKVIANSLIAVIAISNLSAYSICIVEELQ